MAGPANARSPLIPSLRYRDAPKAIEWLCEAFGFEKNLVVPGPDGTIAHAQLAFGNGMLMLGSGGGSGGHGERIFDRLVQVPDDRDAVRHASIYGVVDDADAHCARARAAGAEILEEPRDEDYGGRGYMCRDLGGHVWNFGTYDPRAGG